MTTPDPSLRLRPWVALVVFISAYAPLLLILAIKDLDISGSYPVPKNPGWFGGLLVLAVFSCAMVLRTMSSIREGLQVQVSKAANKSGEMFGYTTVSYTHLDVYKRQGSRCAEPRARWTAWPVRCSMHRST